MTCHCAHCHTQRRYPARLPSLYLACQTCGYRTLHLYFAPL